MKIKSFNCNRDCLATIDFDISEIYTIIEALSNPTFSPSYEEDKNKINDLKNQLSLLRDFVEDGYIRATTINSLLKQYSN